MKAFLLLLSFFAVLTVSAQKVMNRGGADASWKLLWGKKTLLKAAAEDEAANVIALKRSDLRKANSLQLLYTPAGDQQSGWKRTIAIYDAADNELYKKEGNTLKISNRTLARLANGKAELKIYTMAVPSDPAKAALVRVRRVHLVTIRVV